MTEDSERDLPNRVWRNEQRIEEHTKVISRIEDKIDRCLQWQNERGWKIDRADRLEERVNVLERRSPTTTILGESSTVRTIILGLLAIVFTLATGKVLSIAGVF